MQNLNLNMDKLRNVLDILKYIDTECSYKDLTQILNFKFLYFINYGSKFYIDFSKYGHVFKVCNNSLLILSNSKNLVQKIKLSVTEFGIAYYHVMVIPELDSGIKMVLNIGVDDDS